MSDGVELATAYVSLAVSMRGIEGQVRREVGDPLEKIAAQSGKEASRKIEQELERTKPDFRKSIGDGLVSSVRDATSRASTEMGRGLDKLAANSTKLLTVGAGSTVVKAAPPSA